MQRELYERLRTAPYLPTAFPMGVDTLCQFARLLHEEGYPAIELLARPEEDLLEVFHQIGLREERSLILWGIGTVKTAASAEKVIRLRPDFVVSPAFSCQVLKVCEVARIPYVPAVYTFQDVQNVVEEFEELGLNLQLLKLCPVYGLTTEYVQAMSNCFPGISFCPTGEITLENYCYWKSLSVIVAPMGSRVIPLALLEAGDFTEVRRRLRLLRDLSQSC